MKYILILSIILFSCSPSLPVYRVKATITKIAPEGQGFWIYLRTFKRVYFKTYQDFVPDTIFVGKVVEWPVMYRIK